MDRYLTLQDDCADEKNRVKENINKLIDIYYEALDAPKNGWKVIFASAFSLLSTECSNPVLFTKQTQNNRVSQLNDS